VEYAPIKKAYTPNAGDNTISAFLTFADEGIKKISHQARTGRQRRRCVFSTTVRFPMNGAKAEAIVGCSLTDNIVKTAWHFDSEA